MHSFHLILLPAILSSVYHVLGLPQQLPDSYEKHIVKEGETCFCIAGENWKQNIENSDLCGSNLLVGTVLSVKKSVYQQTNCNSVNPVTTSPSNSDDNNSDNNKAPTTSTSSSTTEPTPTCRSYEVLDGGKCITGCSNGHFLLYDKDLKPAECSDLNGISFKVALDGENMYLENAGWANSYRHTVDFNGGVSFRVKDGKIFYAGENAVTVRYIEYKVGSSHRSHSIKDHDYSISPFDITTGERPSPLVLSTLSNGSLARLTIQGRNSEEDCINNGPEQTLQYGYGSGDCMGQKNGGYNFKLVKNF